MQRQIILCLSLLSLNLTLRPAHAQHVGEILRIDSELDSLIAPDAKIEKLAEGYDWSEGPVWLVGKSSLIFSDVPKNVIHLWSPDRSKASRYIEPSGDTGQVSGSSGQGSNGLTIDATGRLVLMQHGDRRVARREVDGTFTTLADRFQGKRLNSPNDGVYDSHGNLYFTDPPYGLPKGAMDPGRELDYSGVFCLSPDGRLKLLTKELRFPNGIAFSPDGKMLYVANSDPNRPILMAYPVLKDGSLGEGKVLVDTTDLVKAGKPGLPDGLKVDIKGKIFMTGPGGVHVIAPDGKILGRLDTGVATANCAWGDDGSTLYLTADSMLCRLKTLTRGTIPGPSSK
ncbi:MAG: Gluconolactonase precursor [Planctomycetota bacterium]